MASSRISDTRVSWLIALGVSSALAACSQQEASDATTDSGADFGASVHVPVVEPPAFDQNADGLMVIPFEVHYEPGDETLNFEFEAPRVFSEDGLATATQALWCQDRLRVVNDGTVGTGAPNTAELVSSSVRTFADCNPSTFPDGSPGPGYGSLLFSDGALCADVTLRSFYNVPFRDAYAEIVEILPLENAAYSYADRVLDGLGTGAQSPAGAGAPGDSLGGLFYFGDVIADDPAGRSAGTFDNAVTTPWVFRYPVADAPMVFRGRMVVRVDEVCNGVDDDCDGRVDEGVGCFSDGIACVDDSDCGLSMGGDQLNCVDPGTGVSTCGGTLADEDCTGNTDTNGNGLVGCQDPTCSGVAGCVDFACVDGNIGAGLSDVDGDYVRVGTVTSGETSDFTLPSGELRCGSRFLGADRGFVWEAPQDGEYTFSTSGSTYDTALVVVEGSCPLALSNAFANGTALCADDHQLDTTGEDVVMTLTAGDVVTIIVDSALPSSGLLGSGGWTVSVFKTPECGDGIVATTDRFGNAGEACDASGFSPLCDDDCTLVECGDGLVNPEVEGCEDGNFADGDGCSVTCQVETGYECDAGGCAADCGDGFIVAGEEGCDDGNAVSGDGCPIDCAAVESGWTCATPGAACASICGDGVVVGSEVCDSPGAPGCTNCAEVDSGYACPPTGGDCSDIDECAAGGGGCSVNGECNNIPGGYFCSCLVGYRGDGLQCDDINECDPGDAWFVVDGNPYVANGGCDPNALCTNSEGSLSCACNDGYTGTGESCSDINECIVGLPSGDEACDPLATCTNSAGSYSCGACPPGYSGDGAAGCTPQECLDPGNPTNGAKVGTYATFVLGTEVQFECNSGYTATSGDVSRTCVPDGAGDVTFNGSPLVCERRACPAPPALSDGSVSNPQGSWVYEDVANYACASGFVPAGGTAPFATCQSDGAFSAVVSSCTPIDCGALTAPTSGSVDTSAGTVFGDEATYTCDSGYNAVGATARTCGSDGTWSGVAPSCERITCTPPSPPANAQLSGGPYEYVSGEALTFACDEGYQPVGSLSRTCQLNGTYTTLTGSCALVDCGALSAPANGTMSGAGTTYQSERTFGCNGGYTATGAATRICQATGVWSGTPFTCTDCNANPGEPECSSLDCGSAPAANDGRSSLSSVSSTFLTGQATYTCDASSTTNGLPAGGTTYIRSCQSAGATGAWSLPTATCQEVDCGALTGSGALSVSTPDTTVDGVATYSCSAGYRLSGGATRTCTTSGWSGTAPTCGALTCPAPTPVTGGLATPSSGGNAIASTATHSCNSAAGYVASGGTTGQTCIDDGNPGSSVGAWQWGGAPLECTLRECPTFDVVNSTESVTSAVGPNGRSVGSVVSFSCDSGYVVQGTSVANASRTCGTNGQWTGGLPVCVRRACDVLPGAPGTVAGGANYTYPAGYSSPVSTTSATYNCAAGTRIGGSPTGAASSSATCGDSGSWTAWSGTCQAVSCGTPPVAAGGSNSSRDAGWNAAAGGTATYTCTPGYSINGAAASAKNYAATCVDGAGWQLPADSTCEAFVCDALANVTVSGGTAAVVSYQTAGGTPTASRAYANRAVYNRQTGYRLLSGSTSTARTCQVDGTWSGVVPTYERMQCPAISATALTATYRTNTNAVTADRYVGYTASFACTISGLSPTTGTQTCSETTDTNVRWEIPIGTGAPSVTCGNVNECATSNACGEDSDNRNTCTDRTPTSSSGGGATRFECGCSAANGWTGAVVANAPASCDGVCGDGLVRGTEVCDDGAWNDRPWESINGPGTPHPRYGSDCEGVECDCSGPNAASNASCIANGARTICLDNGIPAAGLAAADCRATSTFTAGRCTDGQDTDGDGRTDCADPGCSGKASCPNWRVPGCQLTENLGEFEGSINRTLYANTAQSPDTHWVQNGHEDYSFLWQAPYPGTWRFETCNGGTRTFDTVMGAYSSLTCGAGYYPNLAYNDDADASKATRLGCSVIDVAAQQGEPITVVVSAFGGNSGGNFPLSIYPIANSSCGNGLVETPRGLGMAATNARVPDSRITASSWWDNTDPNGNHAPYQGRLYDTDAGSNWSAGANNASQWLQVDFQAPVTATSVATQGRHSASCGGSGCGQYVREYRLESSMDGATWTPINNARAFAYKPAQPDLFPANWDQDTVAYNQFDAVRARFFRIRPTAWSGHITMRAEFFTFAETCDDGNNADGDGCSRSCFVEQNASCIGGSPSTPSACFDGVNFTCGDGVVEANGDGYSEGLPDSSFAVSSWWQFNNDPNYAPNQMRMTSATGWHPASGQSSGHWLQMDLGSARPVGSVATRGRPAYDQWTTRYQVRYSNDGVNYTLVDDGRIFTGNSDRNTPVYNTFPTIVARYWRLYPVEWYSQPAMRLEFYPPLEGYSVELPNSAFSASSYWSNNDNPDYHPSQGRIDNQVGVTVWHPASGSDYNTLWWQMDLGSRRPVGAVATRGRNGIDQWTTSYRVSYSDNGVNYTFVEGGKVFRGNTDRSGKVFNTWTPILARYWRIHPVSWQWTPVLRADFYPTVEECDDGNLNNGDGCSNLCQVEDNFRCYGAPSLCGSRRTVLNQTGMNNPFGYSSTGSDVRIGPANVSGCNTVTGVESFYNMSVGHTNPEQLVIWVHDGGTINQLRGDGWFPVRQGGYFDWPGWNFPGGSTPSTMLNGRSGNGQWYTQVSDYVLDADGGNIGSMSLDIYCR